MTEQHDCEDEWTTCPESCFDTREEYINYIIKKDYGDFQEIYKTMDSIKAKLFDYIDLYKYKMSGSCCSSEDITHMNHLISFKHNLDAIRATLEEHRDAFNEMTPDHDLIETYKENGVSFYFSYEGELSWLDSERYDVFKNSCK